MNLTTFANWYCRFTHSKVILLPSTHFLVFKFSHYRLLVQASNSLELPSHGAMLLAALMSVHIVNRLVADDLQLAH